MSPHLRTHQDTGAKLPLPDTIVTQLFSYLDPESLARAAAVSHPFRELAYSEYLWKTLVNIYLGPANSDRIMQARAVFSTAFHYLPSVLVHP